MFCKYCCFFPGKESGLQLTIETNGNTNLDLLALWKKNLNQLTVTYHNINYIRNKFELQAEQIEHIDILGLIYHVLGMKN